MMNSSKSFLIGGVGCLASALIFGLIAVVVGGSFYIDPGGVIILLVIGGCSGLVVHLIYARGRRDAISELTGAVAENQQEVDPPGPTPRRQRDFLPPWEGAPPDTVDRALLDVIETYWKRDHPETSYSPDQLTVQFRSQNVQDERILRLIASEVTDDVTIEIIDPIGELDLPTGPWRSSADFNADLAEVFRVVEEYFCEGLVHVRKSSGDQRLVETEQLDSLIGADEALRVCSWGGEHDR